ncbi:hypothetical protein [Rhodococcus sp. DMU1]|uniref:hypothetical protein n=1 Tax=Rhodococcus sp. DMU1 TaxID=2722825 RepID=UPI001FF0C0C3|nr:hypothetical protein [Rhodococcus sp. DMU1]
MPLPLPYVRLWPIRGACSPTRTRQSRDAIRRSNSGGTHKPEYHTVKWRSVSWFGTDVIEYAKQVREDFVGFVFDAVADVGDIRELTVRGVAGVDAAVVVVRIELDVHDFR